MRFFVKIVTCVFWIPQLLMADLTLFEKFLFSDKFYARNIEVKMYILTEKQSAALLKDPSKEPVQLFSSELVQVSNKYLVVRVRNLGNYHAWGRLACSLPGVWSPVKIPIIGLGECFSDYFICITGIADSNEPSLPKLSYKWDQLYTK